VSFAKHLARRKEREHDTTVAENASNFGKRLVQVGNMLKDLVMKDKTKIAIRKR